MSDALYAGAAIRRLRRVEGLTQAAMASRLSVSPSYLNLIERNRRPLSAQVIVRLVDAFDFDPRDLKDDPAVGGVDGLMRRFADERLSDLGVDREEADEFLASSPRIASALARLFDEAAPRSAIANDALIEVRHAIERWSNHFPDLDHAAEQLADVIRLSSADTMRGLTDRLREKHQLSVRVLPVDVIGGAARRIDYHARQVQLSEMMEPASRQFQLAAQIVDLELLQAVRAVVGSVNVSPVASDLLSRHVRHYAAAAIVMPYGRFLRACDQTSYDVSVLRRRFGVSFEQVAHRLTTLQRTGQRGLPFFMIRVDGSGQISKRLLGGSKAAFLEKPHICPLWGVHEAFFSPEAPVLRNTLVDGQPEDAQEWTTLAQPIRTLSGARHVVVLGLQTNLADAFATRQRTGASSLQPIPTGPGCAHCHRPSCFQRAVPPIDRGATPLSSQESANPYSFDIGTAQ